MCLSKPSSCFGSYLRQELHTLSFSGELSSKVPSLTGFLEHPSFGFRDINVISSHYYYFLDVFIYLAEPGLSYNTWDLPSSLWPVGALVVAYRIFFFFLVAACGIKFPDQGLNGNAESQPLDCQGSSHIIISHCPSSLIVS